MNTKQRFRPGRCLFYVTGAILTYVLCGAARGQVSEQYDLSWSVLSGGGGVCVSGANSIQDAVGQSVGAVSDSATFHIEGGFIVTPGGATGDMVHPADVNEDWHLVLSEAIAYLAGWQQGSNPIAYAIRAAYLWQNGEHYQYNAEETPPLCWELVP